MRESRTQDESSLAEAWSRYWMTGARHSCAGSFDGHYGSATRVYWRNRFKSLKPSDRVVELGCGNGSLIRFLQECGSACWPTRYSAVDSAHLDRRWWQDLGSELRGRVDLHDGVGADRLPLADGEAAAVFSQFALEYFANPAVWWEILRVMAPTASLCVVAHRQGSRPYKVAQAERDHCDWLLRSGGALDVAVRVLPYFVAAGDTQGAAGLAADVEAGRLRKDFNAVYAELEERARSLPFADVLHEVAESVMGILRSAPELGEDAAAEAFTALRAKLRDNRRRIADLVACALTREDLQRWVDPLAAAGFGSAEIGELDENSHPFAWTFTAHRVSG